MNSFTEMNAEHPLFKELRNGLLWHRTSPEDYRLIRIDGAIRPNDGRINRWGQKYACQQLGGLSLFDFTTESEEKVLQEATDWQPFLGSFDPITVLLGIDRNKVTRRLIPYPKNKEGTTGYVIPWVEVCHRGQIPLSVVSRYLLVCPVDYTQFRKFEILDEPTLLEIEREFAPIVKAERDRLASVHPKQMDALRQDLSKHMVSDETVPNSLA